ncbi:MAG TPA: dihydrofolate reductase family protein [Patescibacteria group bacterium]|nr:dihydrofolate reductase family protein [Patescibacteria group bacterium]
MKVIAIVASTLDGKIAKETSDNTSWTSREDKKFFQEETKKAGVLIMGRTTFDTIGRSLPGRKIFVLTKGKRERIGDDVIFSNAPLEELLRDIEKSGYKTVFVSGGASVYTEFMKEDLVDEVWITFEPYLFGSGIPFMTAHVMKLLKRKEIIPLGTDSVVVKYDVVRQRG